MLLLHLILSLAVSAYVLSVSLFPSPSLSSTVDLRET